MNKGFTLIELLVVLAIIAILSGIVMFSVSQFVSSGKDNNIKGNLVVLIPAGEVYYNINGSSYQGFCGSGPVSEAFSQIPVLPGSSCMDVYGAGRFCCNDWEPSEENFWAGSWVACGREFTNSKLAYCVDSRGIKKEICNSNCTSSIKLCPDNNLSTCP